MELLKLQFLFSGASKDGGLKRELQEFEKQPAKDTSMARNNKSSKLKTKNNSTNNKIKATPSLTPSSPHQHHQRLNLKLQLQHHLGQGIQEWTK